MKDKLGGLSVGAKLTALSCGLVVASFAVFSWLSISLTSSAAEEKGLAALTAQTDEFLQMLTAHDVAMRRTAELASKVFAAQFRESLTIDPTATVAAGGVDTPVLKCGEATINNDVSIVDRFTSEAGFFATVFVRKGDELYRVATSMKKQDGSRAVGTSLDHTHPGYTKILAGESFTGKAKILGRDFMTRYVPIRGADGKVIGALYVGADFTEDLKALADGIKRVKLGDTGYFYALDDAPGPSRGVLTIHPAKEGKNILESRDSDGRAFIREILDTKNGVIRYPWQNAELGESAAREKIVVFRHFEAWDWVVAGGTYTDEFTREAVGVRNTLLLGALVAALLLSATLYGAFQRVVVRPLKQAVFVATRAGEGDLSCRVEVKSEDEVGQLMAALRAMNASLSRIVAGVRTGTLAIASGSGEIATGSADLARRTLAEASSLEETAASMEQLTSTVKRNAEHAGHASQLAVDATAVAGKGKEAVGRVVHTMSSIHASSAKIEDIIGVIEEIAFQTNILALNAAVEAARAGAEGRGFAVVAEEVHTLAQRSARAAKEIEHIIAASIREIDAGARLAGEAGETMEEIVGSVSHLSELVTAISTSSAEQSTGIAQVNVAVTQLDQTTQANASLVEEAAAAADMMRSQAQRLEESVSVFKIAEPAAAPKREAPPERAPRTAAAKPAPRLRPAHAH